MRLRSVLGIATLAATLAVLSVGDSSAEAQAADARAVIGEVREDILYARYDEAIERATAFLERSDLSAEQRNEGLEVLATAHLANRNMTEAEPLLGLLYSRDPGHRLRDGDASPLVQGAFQRAREARPAPVEVQLQHTPPLLEVRESPMIEVRVVEGADAIGELRLAYRTGGAPRFATLVMNVEADSVARGRVPLVGPPGQEQRIEYYVDALAPSLTSLGTIGSEATPMALIVPADTRGPSERPSPLEPPPEIEEESRSKWWIAIVVLGVAAGAAVGGYFLFGPPSDEPNGSLGAIDLR